ncbi:MAG: hypothetical protein ACYDGR_01020 [Candidatus Dormibacteria bacterium]
MISLTRKRTRRLRSSTRTVQLSSQLTFLDVVQDACARGERFTITLSGKSQAFTILVDRGGPFNALGGGLTGSPALVAAAEILEGTCTVQPGWPNDQPLYQLGLDVTLKELLTGIRTAAPEFPRARGVDAIRNDEIHAMQAARFGTATPVQAPPSSIAMPVVPHPAQAIPAMPAMAAMPVAVMAAPPPRVGFAPATVFEPGTLPQPPSDPGPVSYYQPQPLSAPARVSSPAEPELLQSLFSPAPMRSAAEAPRQHQGPVSVLATRALLWLVHVEAADRYTLPQAREMVLGAVREGVRGGLDQLRARFHRGVVSRVEGVRGDWAKAGHEAAKLRRPARRR